MSSHAAYSVKLLIVATVVAVAGKLVLFNSVGCDAFDHDRADYMAYCGTDRHAHYDHAAFVYDLERGVRASVDSANLLILGSSHIQTAMSSGALVAFEKNNPHVRPYLMGFGYFEQDVFSAAVIRELHPTPKVVVINADPFFSDSVSVDARKLLQSRGTQRVNALAKKAGHSIVEALCGDGTQSAVARQLCGTTSTLYRSRRDGRWIFNGEHPFKDTLSTPTFYPGDAELTRYAVNAERFVKAFAIDRTCVVITLVPDGVVPESLARSIADRVGATFIAPRLDHLGSPDGSHLDTESAERWSAAFLVLLEPVLKRCL
jgi:hypothetical protein